jgi:hypothetical protein
VRARRSSSPARTAARFPCRGLTRPRDSGPGVRPCERDFYLRRTRRASSRTSAVRGQEAQGRVVDWVSGAPAPARASPPTGPTDASPAGLLVSPGPAHARRRQAGYVSVNDSADLSSPSSSTGCRGSRLARGAWSAPTAARSRRLQNLNPRGPPRAVDGTAVDTSAARRAPRRLGPGVGSWIRTDRRAPPAVLPWSVNISLPAYGFCPARPGSSAWASPDRGERASGSSASAARER